MTPRVEFTTENKVAKTDYNYPKLKLTNGEHARVLVGLESPLAEYVHNLRAPKIVDGRVQMVTEKRRDQSEYQTPAMEFLSNPLCLGDPDVLDEKGADPAKCPMCKMAQENSEWVKPPQLRYAMHVVRYRTQGGSFKIQEPFNVETLVWAFTSTIFNKLVDLRETWGDLRGHDLLLGPCTNQMYQKFDINVAPEAAWQGSEENKQRTVDTFRNNQIPDLTIACGSKKSGHWLDQDLATIREKWRSVNGTAAPADAADSSSLDTDLNDLMGSSKPSAPAAQPQTTTATEWAPSGPSQGTGGDVLGDLDSFSPSAPAQPAAPAAEAPAAAPAKTPTPVNSATNFDDLLGDL